MPPSDDALARMRFDANRKSLVAAYVIWFLLGYGGVHRMYLGRWVSGVVMLGIFALSWVLTFVFIGYAGLGLIFLWWMLDALLIPGMARSADQRLIDTLRR
ncbi:TM2 domain-containing protein [Sabulicella rubraurantiaca]|uniref:TM2 domain-containing protein n=1 Tax=Sabulicella rubraurantiaca TaxID=2811429 RepID=UPI001A96B775|nr:TM2 domain-containing protein [Sabulicella rubraurantiaca]